MVERLTPLLGRFDTDSQRLLHFLLPDVLIQRLRSKNVLLTSFFVRGAIGHDPLGHDTTPIPTCPPASVDTSAGTKASLDQAEPHCRNQVDTVYIPGSSPENSAPFSSTGIATAGHHP